METEYSRDSSEALTTAVKAGALSILIAAMPFIPAYREFTFLLIFSALVFCVPVLGACLVFIIVKPRVDAKALRWFYRAIALCVTGSFLLFLALSGRLTSAISFGSPISVFLYFPLIASAAFVLISEWMIRSRWRKAIR